MGTHTAGELLAYEGFKAAKRKFPGAHRLSFRDTGKGWAVRPDYTPHPAGSVRFQQGTLGRRLVEIRRAQQEALDARLAEIKRSL
jgi:hypothetical protein